MFRRQRLAKAVKPIVSEKEELDFYVYIPPTASGSGRLVNNWN